MESEYQSPEIVDHPRTHNPRVYCGFCPTFISKSLTEFISSIICPRYFIFFNLICVFQTVPALYYYISFFKKGFFMENTCGMPTVWGATVGAICSVIVTSALGPLPPNTIFRPFCIAVIFWEYLIFFSLFIAAICLGVMGDYNGVSWSVFGSISGLLSGLFLTWLGKNLRFVRARHSRDISAEKDLIGEANALSLDLPLPSIELTQIQHTHLGDEPESFDGTGLEGSGYHNPPEHVPSEEIDHLSTAQWGMFVVVQFLLWTILAVFCVIPAGFGINQALTAAEYYKFTPLGKLFDVPLSVSDSRTAPMHIYCIGSGIGARPTLVLEADASSSGLSLIGLQESLSSQGWRVCAYDRAGFGWSQMAPLGDVDPVSRVYRLHALLTLSGELLSSAGNKLVLIGYGYGVEMVQIFANQYPDYVFGLVLMDGYPSDLILNGQSNLGIKKYAEELCGTYQIGRALDSIGILRPVASSIVAKMNYHPSAFHDRLISSYNNGRYWASIYSEICVKLGDDIVRNTRYLASIGTQSIITDELGDSINWPPLPSGIVVLVLSAEYSLTQSKHAASYAKVASLYNSTLPTGGSASLWVICPGCKHTFPLDSATNSGWTGTQIDKFLSAHLP